MFVVPFAAQRWIGLPVPQRPFEFAQLTVEVIKLGARGRDLGTAIHESGEQVGGHLVAAAIAAERRETARFVKVESQRSERDDDPQPAQIGLVVFAIAGAAAPGFRQDAFGFVEANGACCHAGASGELGNLHVENRKPSSDLNVNTR
jgi:hypothetical protein